MNEELWQSVERKMRGFIQASYNLGVPCTVCSQWLEPHDTGVDPVNGKRMWITDCCGIVNLFEEKITGFEVILDD